MRYLPPADLAATWHRVPLSADFRPLSPGTVLVWDPRPLPDSPAMPAVSGSVWGVLPGDRRLALADALAPLG